MVDAFVDRFEQPRELRLGARASRLMFPIGGVGVIVGKADRVVSLRCRRDRRSRPLLTDESCIASRATSMHTSSTYAVAVPTRVTRPRRRARADETFVRCADGLRVLASAEARHLAQDFRMERRNEGRLDDRHRPRRRERHLRKRRKIRMSCEDDDVGRAKALPRRSFRGRPACRRTPPRMTATIGTPRAHA
jgi:hypothetical protein